MEVKGGGKPTFQTNVDLMNFPDFEKMTQTKSLRHTHFLIKMFTNEERSAFGKLPTIPPDIYPQKECEAIYFRLAKLCFCCLSLCLLSQIKDSAQAHEKLF